MDRQIDNFGARREVRLAQPPAVFAFFSGDAFLIILFSWLRAFFRALILKNGGVLLGWSMI